MTQTEIELKLLALDDHLLDEVWRWERIGDWRVVGRRRERQHNEYFGSSARPDRRTAATLRWRTRPDRPIGDLTFKTDKVRHGPLFRCEELSLQLPADRDPRQDERGAQLFEAVGRLGGGEPKLVLELETDRRLLELARGPSRVELALDVVTAPSTDYEEHEIEAELVEGELDELERLAETLLETGRLRPAHHGKRSRALRYLAAAAAAPRG